MSSKDYDVIIATDLRGMASTTDRVAHEVELQARMGLRTGLVHIGRVVVAEKKPWPLRIRALLSAGLANTVGPSDDVSCSLLVLRQPGVFAGTDWSLAARSDQTIMVVDQLPSKDVTGAPGYDVALVADRLSEELDQAPRWAPVSATVRGELEASDSIELTEEDWHEIVDVDSWPPRSAEREMDNAIGRYAPTARREMWPETHTDLLGAYPESKSQVVRFLGGKGALRLLGRRPKNWKLYASDSISPRAFVGSLGVYVHFHHSKLRHASSHRILEALACGVPVVTHPYLERQFGDACHYCDPSGAKAMIDELLAAGDRSNPKGIELVGERHHWTEHAKRLERFLGRAPAVLPPRASNRKKVLFMSSNGTGMGHLTRLLAIARQLPPDYEPLFLTLSSGLKAVVEFDHWIDYIPSSRASGLATGYHSFLEDRVGAAIKTFRPDAVVFDGTFPYQGLRMALDHYPQVQAIWSRRAMWKSVEAKRALRALEHMKFFDVVIEPGEFAADVDHGATRELRALCELVEPITLLDDSEILSREEARKELEIAPDEVVALLNLGAGNINRVDGLGETIAAAFDKEPQTRLFVLQSLIAKRAFKLDNVSAIEMYPLARVLRAFDFCIAAPGYNSFHELLSYAVPTVFIPNEATALDSQLARAQWASEQGLCLMAREDDLAGLTHCLERLLEPTVRDRLRAQCRELGRSRGGAQAAAIITARIEDRRSNTPIGDERQAPRRALANVGIPGAPETGPVQTQRLSPFVRRWLWQRTSRVRKLLARNVPAAKKAQPQPRPHTPTTQIDPQQRTLVVARDLSDDDDSIQALVDWAAVQPFAVVVAAPAKILPALVRRGISAELLTDNDEQGLDDRLGNAVYAERKAESIRRAYGCGPTVEWTNSTALPAHPPLVFSDSVSRPEPKE